MLSASSLLARAGEVNEAAARYVALLDHFSAGGDLSHLVTTLRNLVTLFVRLGKPASRAELLGAVAAHRSSPSYGAEAERLTKLSSRSSMRSANGYTAGASHAAGHAPWTKRPPSRRPRSVISGCPENRARSRTSLMRERWETQHRHMAIIV